MREAYRTEFQTEPAEVKKGEAATLVFTIRDAKGNTVRDLAVTHEKRMHLLVISEDLKEFYHLHPEHKLDGSFRVGHTFPHGGNYRLYVDYTLPDLSPSVDRLKLQVTGERRPAISLLEEESATKTVDGLRVTMRPKKPLRAGEEVMLDFAVADGRTNEPVSDLEPYLGALAHFVIVSEDGAESLHAHPTTKTAAGAADEREAHGGHELMPHPHGRERKVASASEVSAHTRFPRARRYKIWAQFQRGGRVITVPFVVRVIGQ
jgi:hypothetical protein